MMSGAIFWAFMSAKVLAAPRPTRSRPGLPRAVVNEGAGAGAGAGPGPEDAVEPPSPLPQAATNRARDIHNRDRGTPVSRIERWEVASGSEVFMMGRRTLKPVDG